MLGYIGGVLLGWSLGANDAANVFGTAVGARMVRWATAAFLAAVFVILGAWLQGGSGVETLSGLTHRAPGSVAASVFAAAAALMLLTLLHLPVSSSQAVVGAMLGVGLVQGNLSVGSLGKVVACWVGTPVGGAVFYVVFHRVFQFVIDRLRPSPFALDSLLRIGLLVAGCYGAYALGANNAANVATFLIEDGGLSARQASLVGGLAIGIGILTFSRRVMLTVGQSIVRISAFSAFIVVLAEAVTIHVYAVIGVPVSTTQAVVGGLFGIGLMKGFQVINWRTLAKILAGWISTPVVAGAFAALFYFLAHLTYAP